MTPVDRSNYPETLKHISYSNEPNMLQGCTDGTSYHISAVDPQLARSASIGHTRGARFPNLAYCIPGMHLESSHAAFLGIRLRGFQRLSTESRLHVTLTP